MIVDCACDQRSVCALTFHALMVKAEPRRRFNVNVHSVSHPSLQQQSDRHLVCFYLS